jgi:hypothetical protein
MAFMLSAMHATRMKRCMLLHTKVGYTVRALIETTASSYHKFAHPGTKGMRLQKSEQIVRRLLDTSPYIC